MPSIDTFIVSESEPSAFLGKTTWLKVYPDGKQEWYHRDDKGWELTQTIQAPASVSHTHSGLDSLPDIITLLGNGITGSKTIGNYKFTFNHGVLVGFEPV